MARVSTIPAGVPFVDALATGLIAEASDEEAGGDALALADMLVLLPNRRACRSLRDAFWRAGGGKALALPTIQPIGDLDPDDLLIDVDSELDLPPAIGGLRRRLLLTRLLVARGWRSDQAGRLADDLAGLLDELQTERVDLVALDGLTPESFAEHWRQSALLLQIISRFWPAVLADEQALDPAERRHRILTAIAERWAAEPPAKRIIAAGSTGTIPATRELLEVIAGLPEGEVVLPGLEHDLDEASWKGLGPEHPQYGLKQLLDALAFPRDEVLLWPSVDAMATAARRDLLSGMMRPSGIEADWSDGPPIEDEALSGLTLATFPDPATEATAIALRLRAALLQEDRTATLITPDRALARRVAIELKRFGIRIDDSAGVPLDQTAPGSFLLLTAKLIIEGVRPVALLAVLKHPLMRAGLEVDVARQRARALDRLCLRGPAIIGGFARIIGELNDRRRRQAGDQDDAGMEEELLTLRDWIDSLSRLAMPFAALAEHEEIPLGELIRAHLNVTEALAMVDGSPEALWAKESGEAAAALFRELLDAAEADDVIPPAAYPGLIAQLMTARLVRPNRPAHPRLTILGQLEARLQRADLTILAGLNEGVWPRAEEPGPWLNPSMRDGLGLPPLERRVGQAAHDFVQAAAGGEVVLSRAEKDLGGTPTVPSRWLTRLEALLAAKGIDREQVEESEDWQAWVERLDLPSGRASPEPRPAPKPALHTRPRTLSVSDIGLWMRNPYGLYARRILRLKPLEPLEADPGASDRGQIVHKALERFVKTHPGPLPDDASMQLRRFGLEAFERYANRPQVRAIWWPRFERMAAWVLEAEAGLRSNLDRVFAEIEGDLVVEAPGGPFRLTARADRLERRHDGGVVIVDYKTGSPPSGKDMKHGLSPQLPLEAAIFQKGGFTDLEFGTLAGLQFWQLSGNEAGGKACPASVELADGALEGLATLVAHYDQLSTAYPASYRPPTARREDYDHLARLGEWPN